MHVMHCVSPISLYCIVEAHCCDNRQTDLERCRSKITTDCRMIWQHVHQTTAYTIVFYTVDKVLRG